MANYSTFETRKSALSGFRSWLLYACYSFQWLGTYRRMATSHHFTHCIRVLYWSLEFAPTSAQPCAARGCENGMLLVGITIWSEGLTPDGGQAVLGSLYDVKWIGGNHRVKGAV